MQLGQAVDAVENPTPALIIQHVDRKGYVGLLQALVLVRAARGVCDDAARRDIEEHARFGHGIPEL